MSLEKMRADARAAGPDWTAHPCCGYEHYWPGLGGEYWVSLGPTDCRAGSIEQIELFRKGKISSSEMRMSYETFQTRSKRPTREFRSRDRTYRVGVV